MNGILYIIGDRSQTLTVLHRKEIYRYFRNIDYTLFFLLPMQKKERKKSTPPMMNGHWRNALIKLQ
jgi:hypothetical protein